MKKLFRKPWVLLKLAVGALLALVAVTQTWVRITLVDGSASVLVVNVSGSAAHPAIAPVAIAALISVVVLAIAGRVFRVVLGVLVALMGAAIIALSASVLSNPLASARASITEVSGLTGGGITDIVGAVDVSGWPVVAVIGGVILLAAGVFAIFTMHRWPVGGRRYETRATTEGAERSRAHAQADHASPHDRISEWESQNDGVDPTDEPPAASGSD